MSPFRRTERDAEPRRLAQVLVHVCDVWVAERGAPAPGTKRAQEHSWRRILTGVRCRYSYTQNDSDPTGIGRIKRRTALTEDALHVPLDVEIPDQAVVVDRTPGRAEGANLGTVHRVQGQPRKLAPAARRHAHKRVYQIFEDEKAAAEVRSAYAG